MLTMGLSAGDFKVYEAGLVKDHQVSTRVSVLSMDQEVLGQVSGGVISGQVDLDSSQDIERTCTLSIRDPSNALGLTGSGPSDPPIVATKMVHVEYGVKIPELGKWVWVPLFTGPIQKADWVAGGLISITGQGKEVLLNSATSMTTTYKKGWAKSSIIEHQLKKQGEQFRKITRWSDKTTSDLVIASTQAPWPVLKQLARSLSGSSSNYPWLGYDGRGYAVLQSHSQQVRWNFSGPQLMSEPVVTYDTERMKNFIVATGNATGSNKKPLHSQKRAPKIHPFSPENLGRGGVPRYVREEITGDWTSQKAIDAAAVATLKDRLLTGVDVSFDTLVIPHLEPRDVVRVEPPTWTWLMQVTKWTVPLGATQAMSHGRTTVVRPRTKVKGRVIRK